MLLSQMGDVLNVKKITNMKEIEYEYHQLNTYSKRNALKLFIKKSLATTPGSETDAEHRFLIFTAHGSCPWRFNKDGEITNLKK